MTRATDPAPPKRRNPIATLALALVLVRPAAGGECRDGPWMTAAVTLHPVRPQPVLTWQRNTRDAMSGPGASIWYRDHSTALDTRWRLEQAGYLVESSPDDEEQVRRLAFAGALMGLERTVNDALDRSDVLGPARRVFAFVSGPGLTLRERDGETRVQAASAHAPAGAMVAAVEQVPSRRPDTRLRLGSGLSLVDLDGDDYSLGAAPALVARVFIDVRALGLDALHLELQDPDLLLETPDDTPLRWQVSARQGLVPGLFLLAAATSDPWTGLPARWRAAVELRPPVWRPWALRLSTSHRLPLENDPADPGEQRVELTLRADLAWRVPQDVDRWPLGLEPGARGLVLPMIEDSGPNQVQPVVRDALSRALDTSGDQAPQRVRGVPGDVRIVRLAKPGQHGQRAGVADTAQRPDCVERRSGLVRLEQGDERWASLTDVQPADRVDDLPANALVGLTPQEIEQRRARGGGLQLGQTVHGVAPDDR